VSIVAEIKARVGLPDISAILGLEFPSRIGRKFCSPFRHDKNPSCSLYQHKGELRFRDWSAGIDVDVIGCYALARGISNQQAIRELARELRIGSEGCHAKSKTCCADKQSIQPGIGTWSVPKPMPREVADAWIEGTNYLARHTKIQEQIAAWRRWTPEAVTQLAEDGMMGTPVFHGERLVAFRVDFPVMMDFGPYGTWFSTTQVGWHVRLKANAGEKPQWRFMPNQGEHGQSTPALPFVLGDFQSSRLLVITEGQFDCITFAHVAGWLNHDAAWPDWVCVIGLRGANGINPFLGYYTPLWSKDVKCWLLPDNDAAGRRWFEAEGGQPSFADRLSALCTEVRVETIAGAKDFNQAWQRNLITQRDIGAQLRVSGFTDQKGRIL
jgi:hypothetical protein